MDIVAYILVKSSLPSSLSLRKHAHRYCEMCFTDFLCITHPPSCSQDKHQKSSSSECLKMLLHYGKVGDNKSYYSIERLVCELGGFKWRKDRSHPCFLCMEFWKHYYKCVYLGLWQWPSGKNTALIYNGNTALRMRQRATGKWTQMRPCIMQCLGLLSTENCKGFHECHPSNWRPGVEYFRACCWVQGLILIP